MSKELIISTNPKGVTAEAIRTLRTNLQFTFVDKNIKTIMVTSSIPGEGKSFISANLAVSFGLIGFKVLLVDCDMRKGRQYKIFDFKDENVGLSNLLLDNIKNYKKYVKKTAYENVSVITSGIVPPNPSELLGSNKNIELQELLKKEYDLIIIDSPPVNAVTDTLVLTSTVDEAVIVCAYKETPIDLLESTKKALENTGVKIAGVVMNKMKSSKSKYYYGKYYK